MRRLLGHAHRGKDGAAAVEMAVVLPILIMLVFGIVAFGIAFAQELALNNSARQGARLGVVQARTCADITSEVRDAVDTIGLNSAAVTVTTTRGANKAGATSPCSLTSVCEGSTPGDNLYVTASHAVTITIPLVFDGSRTLVGEGAFRCETS